MYRALGFPHPYDITTSITLYTHYVTEIFYFVQYVLMFISYTLYFT